MNSKYSFNELETICLVNFGDGKNIYHVCTGEDNPIVFADTQDFMIGMTCLGLCAKVYSNITIIAFQLMSNHFHFLIKSDEEEIKDMLALYFRTLKKALASNGKTTKLSADDCRFFLVDGLDNMRNVITYINRNGYVVSDLYTPLSYPWGTSMYYYSNFVEWMYNEVRKPLGGRERRDLTHSKVFDSVTDLYMVRGYACPLSFCSISYGESMFRNARHYFYKLSKNIESAADISKTIGERIFYTDDELYSIVVDECKKNYTCNKPSLLSPPNKIEMAKKLHYDYNSTNKQIQRILKLDSSVVNALFPVVSRQ